MTATYNLLRLNRSFTTKGGIITAIIVLSANLSGHRYQYLLNLLRGNVLEKQEIYLVTGSDSYSSLSQSQKLELSRYLTTQYIRLVLQEAPNFKKNLLNTGKALFDSFSDSIFVLWDGEEWLLKFLFAKRLSRLLIMRPYYQSKSPFKVSIFLIKMFLVGVSQFNSNLEVGLLRIPYFRPKVFKDLWVDEAVLVNGKKFINMDSNNGVIVEIEKTISVVVPGFISPRKNPVLAIEAFRLFQSRNNLEASLIFAGQIDEGCKALISGLNNASIQIIDEFLTDEQYIHILKNADCILLPYQNRGSSGIVLECLNLEKRIVFAKSRLWMSAQNRTNGLLKLAKLNKVELAEALDDQVASSLKKSVAKFSFELDIKSKSLFDFLLGIDDK